MSLNASSNNGHGHQRKHTPQGECDVSGTKHMPECQQTLGNMPTVTHEGSTPGELDTQAILSVVSARIPPEPKIDMDAVMDGVVSSEDKSTVIAEHHGDLYDSPSCPGAEIPFLTPLQGLCSHWLIDATSHVSYLKKLAAATDPFRDDPGEGTTWTNFDLVKVVILMMVSILLLGTGIFSLSQILLASGLPGFEEPIRRFLFSSVPFAAPFAIKNFASLLGTDRNRRRFVGFVQIAGVALAIAWCCFFVTSFDSGPIASADKLLEELMGDSDRVSGSDSSGAALLFVGLLAEMFLAAGCWLEIERLEVRHRLASRACNPKRIAVDNEVTRLTNRIVNVTALESRLGARIEAIKRGRAAYMQRALNLYRLRCRGVRSDDATANQIHKYSADGHTVPRLPR